MIVIMIVFILVIKVTIINNRHHLISISNILLYVTIIIRKRTKWRLPPECTPPWVTALP